ncbi:MAG: alpha/beta hydrolase-fold protein [bacterium]
MKKIARVVVLIIIIIVFFVQYFGEFLTVINHLWYGYLNRASQVINKSADIPRGLVTPFTFHSKLLGSDRTAYVYLPPLYQSQQDSYPTLYLLHGFAGGPKDWLINAGLAELLDELIAGGQIPPLLVILLDGNGAKSNDSQYQNATLINQPMEDHIVKELVPAIDSTFNTSTSSASRALGGISTGAYGAVNLLVHNPNVFSSAISHSGYFLDNDPASKKLSGDDQAAYLYNSPLLYLPTLPSAPHIHIYFDVGQSDNQYLPVNQQFDALLTGLNIEHEFRATSGWHTWGVWRTNLRLSLAWLGKIWRQQ